MKHNILILTAALALGFASCESDYLETLPNDAISMTTAFSTTEACANAVNGIAKRMTTQYLGSQGMNGEGTMKNWYNNFNSQDCQKCNQTGWGSLWNNLASFHESKTSIYAYYPWYYYYMLIGNANQIIDNVDNAQGLEAEKQKIKAQALVYRAYSYYMLLTMYSDRWKDSNNGAANGVVLRTTATNAGEPQDKPLSTMAEIYTQIYKDLDDAIALFQQSGMDVEEFYLPSLQAAYAVKARAALYREDWPTAADCARKARQGHPLMSLNDYKDGFNEDNDEWIWGVYDAEDQTIYFYAYFAYIGSNSSASAMRTYPVAISKQLADLIPTTDKRLDLFLIPQSDTEFKEMNDAGRTTKGTMFNRAKNSGYVYSTSLIYGYMQFKLRAAFMPGGGSFSLFRSAEMYYTEAEADCHIPGKDSEAAQLLFDVTSKFDPAYTLSTKTGDELLEEIRLYRRFDLFGEGFSWTDWKRWGFDLDRKALKTADGLASAGSWHSQFAITIPATSATRWKWAIPNKETDYNDQLKE